MAVCAQWSGFLRPCVGFSYLAEQQASLMLDQEGWTFSRSAKELDWGGTISFINALGDGGGATVSNIS